MKLYIWRDAGKYSEMTIIATGETLEKARMTVIENTEPKNHKDVFAAISGAPEIHTEPFAINLYTGG